MSDVRISRRSRRVFRQFQELGELITAIIQESIASGDTTVAYFRKQQSAIDKIYTRMSELWVGFSDKETPSVYWKAVKEARRLFKSHKIVQKLDSKRHIGTINAVSTEMSLDMLDAISGGKRDVRRLFRMTQQYNIRESEINKAIRQGLIEKGTPQAIKKELQKKLEKKLIDGKIVTINAEGGKRSYRPNKYAELVARTRTREASTEATMNTIIQYGQDLFQVSDHNTTTPVCIPHEGMVYSISGNNTDFPAGPPPPYHPNCLHVIVPHIASPKGSRREMEFVERQARQQRANDRKLEKVNEGKAVPIPTPYDPMTKIKVARII